MIDPLPIWLAEFEKLPQDSTGTQSPKNITEFIDQRVTGKLDLNNSIAKFTPPPQFTWQKSIFLPLYAVIAKIPAVDPITPAIKIASAWQTATAASLMVLSAGSNIVPPPPGTNGIAASVVAVIDPATLATAYSTLIADLSKLKATPVAANSEFPKAMFKAFNSITFTITGLDTKPPPVGPIPIVLPLTGVM
jgi:hypothetical protein